MGCLAMLALLLAVCAVIVVCSYLIRRRQRRLLDNTIRDGLLPTAPGGFRPRAGAGHALGMACRPELVDVYLGSAPAEKGRRWSVGSEDGAGEYEEHWWGWWNAVMPMAAREATLDLMPTSKPKTHLPSPPSLSPSQRRVPSLSPFARLCQKLHLIVPMPSVGTGVLPTPTTAPGPREAETVELTNGIAYNITGK
ncbi:hypothetical protein C8Q72DRAFT_907653 [Fomitopsis betulina]|nr:hypothetical protein C8Q72DRAFT_907653 [Fomitopsis betulina]